ncbi:hypothetical protein GLW08_02725 [Pontibacillus yanchengensis]|uniref:Uncharacterized protein n=2 Tax=Pontibacillus yanchengensis TaxID=462910 RepID=A0ACC7VBX4_9BACI|nr:VTT domain-containing protein [Pontibacillus yanchengensis]MYL34766.1 hypothetical protein [Pontibacillus yanchengensis]MYL52248.1 hypothetical protein [Pontibacillus yanchengensis]
MLDFIISFIKDIGIFGLLLSLAIEASSLPFPGAVVVLTYGYILKSSALASFGIALLAGAVYTAFSFIPYYIGYKIDHKVKQWFNENKIEKVERWFTRCGEWTIALSRPLGLGNYISYFSGLSKVRPYRFAVITFIGIFPWIYLMLMLGNIGNLESMKSLLSSTQQYIYIGLGVLLIAYISFNFFRKKKQTKSCPPAYSDRQTSTKEHTS